MNDAELTARLRMLRRRPEPIVPSPPDLPFAAGPRPAHMREALAPTLAAAAVVAGLALPGADADWSAGFVRRVGDVSAACVERLELLGGLLR